MPLVQCPECQKDVSSEAMSCPKCAFPYPGKKERLNGQAGETLLPCQDCGILISKHAQACPHCGAPLANKAKVENPVVSMTEPTEPDIQAPAVQESSEQELAEQTWLCPNCGVPYTRRVQRASNGLSELESSVAKISTIKSSPMITPEEEQNTRRIQGAKTGFSEQDPLPSLPKIPTTHSRRTMAHEEKPIGLDGRSSLDTMIPPRKERKRSPLWEEAKAMYEEENQFPRPQKKWGLMIFVIVSLLLICLASFAFWRLDGLNPLEALVYWQM